MQEPESGQGGSPQQPAAKELLPPGARGFIARYWAQAKAILLSPRVFFDSMPTEGGLKDPLVFLSVAAGVNSLLTGIISLNPMICLLVFPATLIGCFLAALAANALAGAMGGKGTFEATFRVYAYSEAPMLFGWIPVIGFFGVFYVWVLNYFGLRKVHDISEGKTVLVVILSGIVAAFLLGLAACGMLLRSIFHF
ncbi:MAG TPA: YIP1 family protein [Candidatus Obscuribacterales bacterium]